MSNTLKNSLLVFIAGSSYGFIVPVIKIAAEANIYPAKFLPLQYLCALIACLVVIFVRRVPFGKPRNCLPMAALGLFTGATSVCYYTAVTLLPSSVALTLLFQYVWVSVLIECFHKRKLPTVSSVIAIVIVLIGTLFATGLLDGSVGKLDVVGVCFGMGSAVFYALFLYFSGIIGVGQPTVLKTAMLALGGLVVTSLINPSAYVESLPNPTAWMYSIALACIGILFPTSLINFASSKLSAGMVSIMASSELPIGILAAWLFVGEQPSPLVMFGAILVLAGIVCKQIPSLLRESKLMARKR